MNTTSLFDLDGLLDLWSRPWSPGPEAEAAFGRFYTDPVIINGVSAPISALIDRSRALNAALADQEREILTVLPAEQGVAVAFRLSGRHVGPFGTSAGTLAPTGKILTLRVIDILTLTDGRVTAIAMVADELGALAAADLVALKGVTSESFSP